LPEGAGGRLGGRGPRGGEAPRSLGRLVGDAGKGEKSSPPGSGAGGVEELIGGVPGTGAEPEGGEFTPGGATETGSGVILACSEARAGLATSSEAAKAGSWATGSTLGIAGAGSANEGAGSGALGEESLFAGWLRGIKGTALEMAAKKDSGSSLLRESKTPRKIESI